MIDPASTAIIITTIMTAITTMITTTTTITVTITITAMITITITIMIMIMIITTHMPMAITAMRRMGGSSISAMVRPGCMWRA